MRFLFQALFAVLACPLVNDEGIGDLILQNVSTLLLASRVTLSPQHRPRLIQAAFNARLSGKLVLRFSRDLFSIPLFEKVLTDIDKRNIGSTQYHACV